jgi:tRNA-dihydrouridine synthase C
LPHLARYWEKTVQRVTPAQAAGRLKQWLALLRRAYPAAVPLYSALRPLCRVEEVDALLRAAGAPPRILAQQTA